jgi:hypothetical protein
MPYTTDAKNKMLTALRADIDAISIHTADPSTTGANEVTGGSPAYARVAVTTADWGAASATTAGAVLLNNDKAFNGPAAANALFYGLWDDTVFLGGGAITGDTVFNAEGDFTLKAGTLFDLNA